MNCAYFERVVQRLAERVVRKVFAFPFNSPFVCSESFAKLTICVRVVPHISRGPRDLWNSRDAVIGPRRQTTAYQIV